MKSLYALLLLGSVFVPFVLSFDKKLQFYKQWKCLFPAIILVAIVYIVFDSILTGRGVWGFNPEYYLGFLLFGLPIEECLFFIIVPYASIFLHDSIVLYFEKLKLGNQLTKAISVSLIILSLAIIFFNADKLYTVYIFTTLIILLLLSFFEKTAIMNRFYITFLVILIPFVIVNGVLTGTGIHEAVVWYNNDENLGIRILTIPVEDVLYGFSMIAFALLLRVRFIHIYLKIK